MRVPLVTLRAENYNGLKEHETINPALKIGGLSLMGELLHTPSHPTKARDIASFCSGIQIVRLILSTTLIINLREESTKESKEAKERFKESIQNIRELLESDDASEIMRYATTMSHLEPFRGVQSVPYPPPERPQENPDAVSYTMTIESEADHLEDLRLAMSGLMEILRGLKLREGIRDHDDSLRLASCI